MKLKNQKAAAILVSIIVMLIALILSSSHNVAQHVEAQVNASPDYIIDELVPGQIIAIRATHGVRYYDGSTEQFFHDYSVYVMTGIKDIGTRYHIKNIQYTTSDLRYNNASSTPTTGAIVFVEKKLENKGEVNDNKSTVEQVKPNVPSHQTICHRHLHRCLCR